MEDRFSGPTAACRRSRLQPLRYRKSCDGGDPQEVLNRELPDDADIFIGLMFFAAKLLASTRLLLHALFVFVHLSQVLFTTFYE